MRRQLLRLSKSDERGIISITVSVVFIMVISMTVLGFAQVSQRNSREALDRQLSSWAFYAAESGANDVMNRIAELIDTDQIIPDQEQCVDETNYTRNKGEVQIQGVDTDVQYTCLIVDTTPNTQDISNLNENSAVLALNSTDGTPLQANPVSWKPDPMSPGNINNCPNPTADPNAAKVNVSTGDWAANCPFSLVKIDLLPLNVDTLGNPLEAAKATMTLYLYPRPGNVSAPPEYFYNTPGTNIYGGGAPQNIIGTAACSSGPDGECRAVLRGLNFPNAYMRVKAMYVPSPTFTVSATSGGTYSYGQVVIDVTGKARDVLRRVQIKANMTGLSSRTDTRKYSDNVLQSADTICKRYYTSPTVAGSDIACD